MCANGVECLNVCVVYKVTWKSYDTFYIDNNQNTFKNVPTLPISILKVTVQ